MQEKEDIYSTLNEEIGQLDSELANKDSVLNTYLTTITQIEINVTDKSTIKSLNHDSVLLDGINNEFRVIGLDVIDITNYIDNTFDKHINEFIAKLVAFNEEL